MDESAAAGDSPGRRTGSGPLPPAVSGPALSNTVSGPAGNVVQAYNTGNIYLGVEPPPVPRQVPSAPLRFTNRDAELRRLTELVDAPRTAAAPLVIVLSGLSGVGKTAMCAQWLHHNATRFTDGHLYADLGMLRRRGGVRVSDVLAGFLRELGVHGDIVPPDLSARAAMYRSKTAGRRLLVLLDDVDQVPQVRPLLPNSAHSVVFVTSQHRLSRLVAEGAVPVPVPPLTTDTATTMLSAMLSPDRAAAEHQAIAELVELCGGLPVVLRAAGARLVSRQRWPVRRLVQRLHDDGSRRLRRLSDGEEVALDGVYDVTYTQLSSPARVLYRRLSLHPGSSFSPESAAALADLPVDDADDCLGELCEALLVEELDPTSSPGSDRSVRYRLHDLIRLHAARCCEDDDTGAERDSAVRRVAEWYLTGAAAADVAIDPSRLRLAEHDVSGWEPAFADGVDALRWLDTERVSLLAVLHEAATRGWPELVWQLCEVLWPFYHSRKYYSDLIAAQGLGVAAARHCGHSAALARMHNQLARAYYETADFDRADTELGHALDAATRASDPRIEAAVVESMGLVLDGRGRHDDAIATFTRSYEINRRIGDRRGMAIQAYHLGQALLHARRADEAARTLTDALDLTDPRSELLAGRIKIVLAQALLTQGRIPEATRAATEAVEITGRHDQRIKEAQALEVLAELADHAGDHATATQHRHRILDLRAALGDPQAEELRRRLDDDQQPAAGEQ